MEHRWGERVQLISGPSYRAAILSEGRQAHRFERQRRAGRGGIARVRVAIDLPLWPKREPPVVEAYVVRKNKYGIGLEWCEFAPDAVRKLLHAVVARPHTRARRHAASASLTVSRLSAPLLKHRS